MQSMRHDSWLTLTLRGATARNSPGPSACGEPGLLSCYSFLTVFA